MLPDATILLFPVIMAVHVLVMFRQLQSERMYLDVTLGVRGTIAKAVSKLLLSMQFTATMFKHN